MSTLPAQPRLRPIIRLFVSSTFSGLKLERDALQQRVFPKPERLCLKQGFQSQAIDLRWGVSDEAGLNHRTMRIRFEEELRRSQEVLPEPDFLILLRSVRFQNQQALIKSSALDFWNTDND